MFLHCVFRLCVYVGIYMLGCVFTLCFNVVFLSCVVTLCYHVGICMLRCVLTLCFEVVFLRRVFTWCLYGSVNPMYQPKRRKKQNMTPPHPPTPDVAIWCLHAWCAASMLGSAPLHACMLASLDAFTCCSLCSARGHHVFFVGLRDIYMPSEQLRQALS